MITVNNISKSFDNIKIINDVSAVFDKGKTNLIIGPVSYTHLTLPTKA